MRGIHRRGEGQGEFGVGGVLVRRVAIDRGVAGGPGESGLADRVEVADEPGRFQPRGERVVESAVGGEHDPVGGDAGDDVGQER